MLRVATFGLLALGWLSGAEAVTSSSGNCYFGAHEENEGCWFLTAAGASCSVTCAAKGLVYDPTTETFAGSDVQVGSASAASIHCKSALAGLTKGMPGAVGSSSTVSSDFATACLQSSFYGGPYSDGAGCWRNPGENFVYRCADIATNDNFVVKSNSLVQPERACACMTPVTSVRSPPTGWSWADVSANAAATSCFFDQGAIWLPEYPETCYCAHDYGWAWGVWDTSADIHGGLVCTSVPLNTDPAHGEVPPCRTYECYSASQADCDTCFSGHFGVIAEANSQCYCTDGTAVPGGQDPAAHFCITSQQKGTGVCDANAACVVCQDELTTCSSDLGSCTSTYQSCQSQYIDCVDNLPEVFVEELCCPVAASLQTIVTQANALYAFLEDRMPVDQEEWLTWNAMALSMKNEVDIVMAIQNPVII